MPSKARSSTRRAKSSKTPEVASLQSQVVSVGVAGWSIPSRYAAQFPGEGSHLERYAGQFNAVEINSSFYRHHREQTYARWAASVPESFRFAVKTPRTLTHEGGLNADAEVLDVFMEEIRGLGPKLAVLLVQLPPKLAFEAATAKHFFAAIQKRTHVPIVCEPRHATWSEQRADSLLADREIARVAADPSLWPDGNVPGGYKGRVYFRWHGQPRKYYSEYGKDCLTTLERQIASAESAADVWAIFDNTAHGFAIENALSVAQALESKINKRRRAPRKRAERGDVQSPII